MTQRSRALAFFGACSLTMLGACAQQVGDIDRTQPNKIEKSAFEGEWYFMQTVVDVNATATASFTGLQGPLERVRFDIREDYLVARRTPATTAWPKGSTTTAGHRSPHGRS